MSDITEESIVHLIHKWLQDHNFLKTSQALEKEYLSHEKKVRDPTQPKRPQTAYFLFLADFRKDTAKEDIKEGETIASLSSRAWANLDAEGKRKYNDLAQAEKEKYQAAMENWNMNSDKSTNSLASPITNLNLESRLMQHAKILEIISIAHKNPTPTESQKIDTKINLDDESQTASSSFSQISNIDPSDTTDIVVKEPKIKTKKTTKKPVSKKTHTDLSDSCTKNLSGVFEKHLSADPSLALNMWHAQKFDDIDKSNTVMNGHNKNDSTFEGTTDVKDKIINVSSEVKENNLDETPIIQSSDSDDSSDEGEHSFSILGGVKIPKKVKKNPSLSDGKTKSNTSVIFKGQSLNAVNDDACKDNMTNNICLSNTPSVEQKVKRKKKKPSEECVLLENEVNINLASGTDLKEIAEPQFHSHDVLSKKKRKKKKKKKDVTSVETARNDISQFQSKKKKVSH